MTWRVVPFLSDDSGNWLVHCMVLLFSPSPDYKMIGKLWSRKN